MGERYYRDDSDDDYDRPIVFKRSRSELPRPAPSTARNTSTEAIVSAAAAAEEPYHVGDDNDDDMEGGPEEHYRSYGLNTGLDDGYGEDGEDYGYGEDGEDYGYERAGYGYIVEENDREYQTDEGSVDGRIQGQGIGGGDAVTDDVSLGTESSMLGTFTDLDVLDCPICCEPLTAPVYQCENGHIECSSCCTKIGNKCPSCSLAIGYIRCRPIERILNSVKFACRNSEYGCKETMLHRKRGVHEKACIFAPCYCPFEDCDFVGSPKNLYAHFRGRHSGYAVQFYYGSPFKFWLQSKDKMEILQEKIDGTIFIINYSKNGVTRAINLICIGVLDPKEEFPYELSVEHEDSKLKLKSVSATMHKWSSSRPLKKYLLVPSDFVHPSGDIKVSICIQKRRGS